MKVEYTPQFRDTLDNMFTCNRKYYSNNVLSLLVASLRKYRDLLADNPFLGAIEPLLDNLSVDYRYIVLNPYLKLIYFILDDTLYYADIWDTRQSEENLKKRIYD